MNDVDEVSVLVSDLRLIARALNAAYGSQAAWDLLEQYRALNESPRKSQLSRALTTAYNRVNGYIKEADNELPDDIDEREGDDGTS